MLTSPQLETAINTALGQNPAGVVIDFTDVEFLASAGMGVLVAAHDKAGSEVTISVVADGPATSRPLKLVGIADIVRAVPQPRRGACGARHIGKPLRNVLAG